MKGKAWWLLLSMVVAGCESATEIDGGKDMAREHAVTSSPLQANLARTAEALADALADEKLQRDVRQAMRRSRYAEHKLDLQAYVLSNHKLAAAAGAHLGITAGEFIKLVSSLGPTDFYAPYVQQRRSWRGGTDVAVGYTDNPDQILFEGFSTSGQSIVFNGTAMPDRMTFILHPAEHAGIRLQRPANERRGDVIQDADEMSGLGALIEKDPRTGRIISVTPFQECNPEVTYCGGGGGGGGGTSVYSRLRSFFIYYGDGVGSAEIEYTVSDNSHTKMVRFEEIGKEIWYTVNKQLWLGAFNWNGGINVELIETDAFADDFWGYATYRTISLGSEGVTEAQCSDVGDPNTDVHPECSTPPYLTWTSNFIIQVN